MKRPKLIHNYHHLKRRNNLPKTILAKEWEEYFVYINKRKYLTNSK